MKAKKQELKEPFQQHLIKSIFPGFSNQKLMFLLDKYPWINYSLGCMFGSFIGDSLGAYLEFSKKIDEKNLNQAMNMTAGGTFNLRSGQVTDDSQMSFHLLEALFKTNFDLSFEQQKTDIIFNIAEEYVAWQKSKPFDIGNTCKTGIKIIQQTIKEYQPKGKAEKQVCLKKIEKRVKQANKKSESNGSLMKITPLIFFGIAISYNIYPQKETKQVYKKLVKDQIKLLHPNEMIIISSKLWFKTLWLICNRESNKELKNIYEQTIQLAHINLKEWAIQVQSMNPMEAKQNQGWAKIAWSIGMRFLRSISLTIQKNPYFQLDSQLYKSYIRRVIQKGGDTDTNAAIVGGLIGSIIGFKNLPREYLFKMFSLNFANKELKKTNDRPEFYEPRKVFVKIYRFLQKLYSSVLTNQFLKPKY